MQLCSKSDLASVSTIYWIMREYGKVRERRNQTSHAPRTTPVLCVAEPNIVYSWDITKMRAEKVFYCLYVVQVLQPPPAPSLWHRHADAGYGVLWPS